MPEIPIYHQFRWKFTAITILFIAVVLAVTGGFSFRAAEEQFNHLLFKEFDSSRNVANNFLKFVEQTALISARGTSTDKGLLGHLEQDDQDALAVRLLTLMEEKTADALMLINHNGKIMASAHDPQAIGKTLPFLGLIQDIAASKTAVTGCVQDLGSFILYGSARLSHPLTSQPLYILAGYSLNNNFVDHIQENSHIDVSLVRERSLIASTLYSNSQRITTLPIPYLEYEMLLADPGRIMTASFLGQDYFLSAERLPFMQGGMAGSMLLVHSQSELDVVKGQLADRFIVIFVVSLIIAALFAFFFAGKMIRPVHLLIEATRQISTGTLQSRSNIDSRDELGVLSKYFNQMADAIEEKDSVVRRHSEELEQLVVEETAKVVEQAVLIDNVLRSSIDLAIAVTDKDLRVKYFNPVAERIFDCKACEVLERTVPEIHGKQNGDHSRFEQVMQQVKKQGIFSADFVRQLGGKEHHIEFTVNRVLDASHSLSGFVLMARDVSQRLEMEQKIQENRKFEAFSILAGGLAHDFNNLLQSIIGGVSCARSITTDTIDVGPMLATVEEAALQAAELSNEMLTLSDGGYVDKKNCNLLPFLQMIVSGNEPYYRCKGALADDLWNVEVNEQQIFDAIDNIVENASEALNRDGILTIIAKNLPADICSDLPLAGHNRIEIVVNDTGCGISVQNLNRIFDPYFSTKQRGSQKGMGLGLATSLSIIKKHKGDITLQSGEGQGTTVAVYLPACTKNNK